MVGAASDAPNVESDPTSHPSIEVVTLPAASKVRVVGAASDSPNVESDPTFLPANSCYARRGPSSVQQHAPVNPKNNANIGVT